MADVYVSPLGAGTKTGVSAGPGHEWDNAMEIAHACGVDFAAGNTYHLLAGTYNDVLFSGKDGTSTTTFICDSGTAIFTSTGTYFAGLYLLNSGGIAFQNFTITNPSEATTQFALCIRSNSAGDKGMVVFTNCIIILPSGDAAGRQVITTIQSSAGTTSQTFTNCTVTAANQDSLGFFAATYTKTTIISGGTYTKTGGTAAAMTFAGGTDVSVTGATFADLGSYRGIYAVATAACGRINISNNTITATGLGTFAIHVCDYWTNAKVTNNTVYSHNNAAAMSGIAVGKDAASTANPMGQVVCFGNRFVPTGTTALAGHGFLLGSGADGTSFYGNTALLPAEGASGINIGLVIKAERCSVHHNLISGFRGLYFKGGGNNSVWNNTIISNGTYGVLWVTDTDESKNNSLVNNIIVGGTYALWASTAGHFNNRFDYNCYVSGSTALSAFDGSGVVKQTALAGLQAYWAALTDSLWTDNDTHSIVADPQFVNAAEGDFRPQNTTVLRSGMPDMAGNMTAIGAIEADVTVPVRGRTSNFARLGIVR